MTKPIVATALKATLDVGFHDFGCDVREHFAWIGRIPARHTRRIAAARAEAMKSAPPCNCYLALVREALASLKEEP